MRELAPGLLQLKGFPPNNYNVYLMGGVLVDARTRFHARGILKELRGQTVEAHALTHAHPDHQGASHRLCEELSVPYWVGAADADAASTGDLSGAMPPTTMSKLSRRTFGGPAHP